MTSGVIEAAGLVKYFGDFRAVDGIDISVPQGSVYGILGPNGAGKTTTIRMLLGIIDPDEGTRSLLGAAHPRNVSDRVGYLPEERGLYPGMKACEIIAFMGALRGLDWSAGRKRGSEMMEKVGLARVVDEKIRKMSKGMAQMVQLIGSIVHRPELIVLDEPFSGLDPVNQGRLEALIGEERARGATIVFSTHVMSHAERLCDRLAIIAGAKRRFEGTVDEARGQLPLEVRYTPADGTGRGALGDLLPTSATQRGDSFRFPIDDRAVAAWLTRLVDSGHGVASLSVERPGLHDAFVHIVGSDGAIGDIATGDGK